MFYRCFIYKYYATVTYANLRNKLISDQKVSTQALRNKLNPKLNNVAETRENNLQQHPVNRYSE